MGTPTGQQDSWTDLIKDSIRTITKHASGEAASLRDLLAAWDTLGDIAEDQRNHTELLLPEFNLLPVLINSAGTTDSKVKKSVWTIILRLFIEQGNDSHFLLPTHSSFPAVIVSTVQTDEALRPAALAVLMILAGVPSNRPLLMQPQVCLLPVLSVLLQLDGCSVERCCAVLDALAEDVASAAALCSADGLLAAVTGIFSFNTLQLSLCAVRLLHKLSTSEENRTVLLDPGVGLLPQLLAQMAVCKEALSEVACGLLFNLSKLPVHCELLFEFREDLLPALLRVVREPSRGSRRVFALYTVLSVIKLSSDARDKFGTMDIGVLATLTKVAQESLQDNNALIVACQILNRLSFSKVVRDKFLWDAEASDSDEENEDLVTALVRALMVVAQRDDGIGRVVACSFIWNVVSDQSFGSYMLPLIPELLPTLVGVVQADDKTYARVKALGILCSLIRHADNGLRTYISLPEASLLPAVAQLLIESDSCRPEEVQKACNILDAMCFAEPVSIYVISTNVELLPALLRLLSAASHRETMLHVCSVLWNLAVHNGSGLIERAVEMDLIGQLAAAAVTEEGAVRYKALGALCNLAVLPQTRQDMGSSENRLLPLLCGLIPITTDDKTRDLMLKLLSFLSLDAVVVEAMATAELGLVAMLVKLIDDWNYNANEFPSTLAAVLWNISCIPASSPWSEGFSSALPLATLINWIEGGREEILQASVHIITNSVSGRLLHNPSLPQEEGFTRAARVLLAVYSSDHGGLSDCAIGGLWNIAESANIEAGRTLLAIGAHEIVSSYVRDIGPDRSEWPLLKVGSKSINFLMNMAAYAEATQPLKECGLIDVALPILMLNSNGCECLKAMFIVVFLVGQDEGSESLSLLHARPDTVSTLVQTLTDTLDGVEGEDYPPGTFCIRLMLQAALALAISDANKQELLRTNIIYLLRDILLRFHGNEPEVPYCGGGGSDTQSAALALSILLHLSFVYESEQELQVRLIVPELGIVPLLHNLIGGGRLPDDAVWTANRLLLRLQPFGPSNLNKSVDTISSERDGALPRGKHVMLSYCWDQSARPAIALRLAAELRAMGIDVWTDRDGSSVVEPIRGCIDDCMARAVQCSRSVLICISPKYKQSASCRMEATYACHLAKKGELKLHFVMMDEQYTTVSRPHSVDGWLGIMTGSALWYPLWDESQMGQTTRQLALVLGEKCAPPPNRQERCQNTEAAPTTVASRIASSPEESVKEPAIVLASAHEEPKGCLNVPLTEPPALRPNPSPKSNPHQINPSEMTSPIISHSHSSAYMNSAYSSRAFSTSFQNGPMSNHERIELLHAMWHLLGNPDKVRDPDGLHAYLSSLGVTEAEELEYCEQCHVDGIAAFLLPIPQKVFTRKMCRIYTSSSS